MNTVEFWERVDQSGGPEACWPWLGTIMHRGYGTFSPDRPAGEPRVPALADPEP